MQTEVTSLLGILENRHRPSNIFEAFHWFLDNRDSILHDEPMLAVFLNKALFEPFFEISYPIFDEFQLVNTIDDLDPMRLESLADRLSQVITLVLVYYTEKPMTNSEWTEKIKSHFDQYS